MIPVLLDLDLVPSSAALLVFVCRHYSYLLYIHVALAVVVLHWTFVAAAAAAAAAAAPISNPERFDGNGIL
jgi:hypothetical protein